MDELSSQLSKLVWFAVFERGLQGGLLGSAGRYSYYGPHRRLSWELPSGAAPI